MSRYLPSEDEPDGDDLLDEGGIDDLPDDDDEARYVPTPDEIRQAAAEIRAGWGEERWRRAAGDRYRRDCIPLVREPDLSPSGF